MTQQWGLTWGALDFAAEYPTDEGFKIDAIADGTNFGNPEAQFEIVRSLLTDGSLAVLQGWDNREAPIRLRLSAPSEIAGPALAAAERALMAAVLADSKEPLVWVPPADDAATCVFDVVAANLTRDTEEWDTEEVQREYRYYLLTLTCLPFARGEELVVVPALDPEPVTPTTVVIDTCDSTAGWTAGPGPAVDIAVSAGRLQVTTVGYQTGITVIRSGVVASSGSPYISLDVSATTGSPSITSIECSFRLAGATLASAPVASVALDATTRRYYFTAPTSFDEMWVTSTSTYAPGQGIWIHQVDRTDAIASSSTGRQRARMLAVSGSAPTQAAIRLTAVPTILGDEVLVHTSRNANWQPPLRPWLTSTAGTGDTSLVSGAWNALGSPMVFRIPASNFTRGTYALMSRAKVTVAGTLAWSARIVTASGATSVGSPIVVSGSASLSVTSGPAGNYQVVTLGSLSLPVVDVEADQMIELTLAGTANMTVDEAWLFGLDDGALTWVRDPSATLRWIEIRSPELGAARPSVYGGDSAPAPQASVCIDWMCESFGPHRFDPGLMQVFTVTAASLASQTELEFYPRYHSHVEAS